MKKYLALVALAAACALPTFASELTASGSITTSSTDCTAGAACVYIALPTTANSVTATITGTFAATLQFESSINRVTWSAISAIGGSSSTTSAGTFNFALYGAMHFRIRASVYTSGTASIALGAGSASTGLYASNSTGNVLIGTTTDDSIDKLQVNGSISSQGLNVPSGNIRFYAATTIFSNGYSNPIGIDASNVSINGNSGGRVLVGTTTDDGTNKLQVAGSAAIGSGATGTLTVNGTTPTINSGGAALYFQSGNMSVSNTGVLSFGKIGSYNGVSTVANGMAAIVAKADATAQSANIASTTLYAVPASGAGMYRATCYIVVTQAATTSSTMPNCAIAFTDADSNTSSGSVWLTGSSTLNTVGTNSTTASTPVFYGGQSTVFNAKASTNIQYSTASYASSGGTAMQYSAHLKLEYLGQ